MTTEIQAAANRRNAPQSTGPRSAEGIEAARFNALRTGFDPSRRSFPGKPPRNGKPIEPLSLST